MEDALRSIAVDIKIEPAPRQVIKKTVHGFYALKVCSQHARRAILALRFFEKSEPIDEVSVS